MRTYLPFLLTLVTTLAFAAQTLNNPIGSDGCYIVKWDCTNNQFAASNDFEADETFVFAVDITGTNWVEWLQAEAGRGICTNFALSKSGAQDVYRDADRLYPMGGNLFGKTINIAQLAKSWSTPTIGSQTIIYSNLFGFNTSKNEWWQNPSDDIVGNSDCFFKTAPYTGKHTGNVFYANDYANLYGWINQVGYAAPCVDTSSSPQQDDQKEDEYEEMEGQIGYYNRPYERYEAELDSCTTNGSFLQPSDDQTTIQSEASHQQALQLIAKDSYVAWTVRNAGDGLTVRFSLPDNAEGTGTKGNIAIYAGNDQVGTLQLDSYWAWQYCSRTYPTNNPNNGPVIRMKFDEMHLRLSRPVKNGETLKVVKTDNNDTPYTIDFIELEPVPAKVIYNGLGGDTVQFTGEGDIADFIADNQGKIIYIPEGRWETNKRIYLTGSHTQLIGAGMWYTTIYFTASSSEQSTYSNRGIECQAGNCKVEGLYLNTINNQRYMNEDSNKQVGKGFMGWWGNNSIIRNCWVEHFECGGWIADYGNNISKNLLVEHCRFRNNYADGLNCSHNTHGHIIRYCSFRNNGDDDMATWSTSIRATDITFAYCTAENNWRASSLGIFGGENHHAHHLLIEDGLECGLRVNGDFSGQGFSSNGTIALHDIIIRHCGCKNGSKGISGDFWGTKQSTVSICASGYDVKNVSLKNIKVYDSRGEGMLLGGKSGHLLTNVFVRDIVIDGATYGLTFAGGKGTVQYCNVNISNCSDALMGKIPTALIWTENCGTGLDEIGNGAFGNSDKGTNSTNPRFFLNGKLFIRVRDNLYDMTGRCVNPK